MGKGHVLVTGASGGIGKAISMHLAEAGYSLYLHYHTNKEAVEELMEAIQPLGVEAIPVQADLSLSEGAEKLCSEIHALDHIVLNSGKAHYGLVTDVKPKDLEEMINIHISSPFIIIQKLLPKLFKSKKASIVAVTSIWGETGASCEVLYSMLKGGQNAYVKALSKELAPMGIRVNAVSPGVVKTQMIDQFSEEEKIAIEEDIPLGRMAETREIADIVGFLLSERSSYITGQIIGVNGGWHV